MTLVSNNIISILMVLFLIGFTNKSCSPQNSITVRIQATEKLSNKPIGRIEAHVYKINNPVLRMRQFNEVCKVKTNMEGIFTFKVEKKGEYSIRFYDQNEKLLFWTDSLKINNLDADKFFILSW